MPAVTELSQPEFALFDRRRSGRTAEVSPDLLPLLRGEAPVNDNHAAPAPPALPEDDPDNLAAARGIILGVGLSAGFWLALGAVLGWWL